MNNSLKFYCYKLKQALYNIIDSANLAEFKVEKVVFKWINECCKEEKKNMKKFG